MRYVVIGGGIAGVCCAQELARLLRDEPALPASQCAQLPSSATSTAEIILISASPFVTSPLNIVERTQHLADFELRAVSLEDFAHSNGVQCMRATVRCIDSQRRVVVVSRHDSHDGDASHDSEEIAYDRVCVCTGSQPVPLLANAGGGSSYTNPCVIGIRDVASIDELNRRLGASRSVAIVGNGGIALELVYALCRQRAATTDALQRVHWLVKDAHIGNAFFDATASAFLMPEFFPDADPPRSLSGESASAASVTDTSSMAGNSWRSDNRKGTSAITPMGGSLGPYWLSHVNAASSHAASHRHIVHFSPTPAVAPPPSGASDQQSCETASHHLPELHLHTCATVRDVTMSHPCAVTLGDDTRIEVDFVVSAVGVAPFAPMCGAEFERDADGALLVDCAMRTTVPDVFAAGDCCSVRIECAHAVDDEFAFAGGGDGDDDAHIASVWMQMRLWTQARTHGLYAAQCMLRRTDVLTHAWPFRVFAHCTQFAAHKVVLLGRFRADEAHAGDARIVVRMRVMPQQSYAKLVLCDGKLIGAVLIGDTDLEETCENLILNQLSLAHFGERLLDDDVDLEEYFD